MMRKGGQNNNMFLRIISTQFRALNKFYVRCITGLRISDSLFLLRLGLDPFSSSRTSSSAAFSSSASSRRTTDFRIDDDYSKLVRAATSLRSLGHKNDIDMFIQEKHKKLKQGVLPKSSSVGMARIDEEEEAEEASVNPKKTKKVSDLLYPCSKYYAV